MADDRISIYGKAKYSYVNESKYLEIENISDRNKVLIRSYINNSLSNNTSPQRCRKLSSILRIICRSLKKDFDKMEKDDIVNIIVEIKSNTKHAEATKQDYIRTLKQFFRWFEDEDERLFDNDPIMRRKITMFYKQIKTTQLKYCRKNINPSDILTDEDIKIAMRYCVSLRDKLFIRLLHETGARAGEILNLRIKHIIFEDDGRAKIHLDGKTGERRIPIAYSVSLLRQFLDEHILKDDVNSPLWWTRPSSGHNHPLKHQGATKLLDVVWSRIPKNLSVANKKHNLHFFRHSRATLLAPKLTESLLCKYFGWSLGSKQVKTYVHLSAEDLDNEYYQTMGLEPKDKVDKNKPKTCQFCNAINDMISDYCHRCGRPLDLETVIKEDIKLEKSKEETYNLLTEMMKSADFMKFAKDKGFNI
jgi:site-specific recombinase XerD